MENPIAPTYRSTEELVTFHIGKDPSMETFKIHKEVVCLYSPVLKAAFNSQFIEGQTQTYFIDDTTKEVFQLLVQWFYGQKFEPFATKAELDSLRELRVSPTPLINNLLSKKRRKHQSSLIGLWILADRLCIPAAQNLVVNELELIRKEYPHWRDPSPYHCLKYVYEHTLPGKKMSDNKLRYLLLMQVTEHCTDFSFKVHSHQLPREMLIDYIILGKRMDKTSRQDIFSKEELFRSTFHVSEEGLEDARMVEAIEGNEPNGGDL
jgi:hypothetical protein